MTADMTDWLWFAAGVGSLVAVLIFASLVSRWFRVPAAHRAGIDEDEDDPEPAPLQLRIQPNLYPRGYATPTPPPRIGEPTDLQPGPPPASLGPPPAYPEPIADWERDLLEAMTPTEPPTYPETPEEHTP
jgi:hypothetical protein